MNLQDIELIAKALAPVVQKQIDGIRADMQKQVDTFLASVKQPRDAFELDMFHVEQSDDGRLFTMSFQQGENTVKRSFKLPALIYRDVFKDGTSYDCGDVVTYGGSAWVAKQEEPQGKPGTGEGWQLAVKRGRDGKDGRNGIDMNPKVKA